MLMMMTDCNRNSLRVLAVQTNPVLGNRETSLSAAVKLLEGAVYKTKTDIPTIACFPELFTTGYPGASSVPQLAESLKTGRTLKTLKAIAKQLGIAIIAGSIMERAGGKYYNTSVLISPQGRVIGHYRKTHLFTPMGEDRYFSKGNAIKLFEIFGTKLAVLTCYDLRFPEAFRKLAVEGAEIVFVPAEFPKARQDHWKALLRARAIENQMFVVGVNRTGCDRINTYAGGSRIIGPNGRVLGSLKDGECVLERTVNITRVRDHRKKIPVLHDRRTNIY